MDGLKARLSFDAVAYDYDDEYLTIDTDTHTININNVSRLFGVQYDGNSKLIKFRIRNKLSDIQKMQDSIVYINWIDSRGVKGQSIAINKTINNDTCEFAWKVPFDALKNSGVLHFAMSAVVTKNSSSVIDQRWSTQIASVITPDGIYIKSYTPSSEEEDRIAQIYNELSNMINKQNDNLQSQVNLLKEDLAEYTYNIILRNLPYYTIDPDGKVITSTNTDLHIARVERNKNYTITTDEDTVVLGWYSKYPEPNDVAHNGRILSDNKTVTSPIDGYIAFRSLEGYKEPQIIEGSEEKPYIYPVTAKDLKARNSIDIQKQEILEIKNKVISYNSIEYEGLKESDTFSLFTQNNKYYTICKINKGIYLDKIDLLSLDNSDVRLLLAYEDNGNLKTELYEDIGKGSGTVKTFNINHLLEHDCYIGFNSFGFAVSSTRTEIQYIIDTNESGNIISYEYGTKPLDYVAKIYTHNESDLDGIKDKIANIDSRSNIKFLASDIACFENVGFCGDSYMAGMMVVSEDPTTQTAENRNICWGKILEKTHGINAFIYARGAVTTNDYITVSECLPKLLSETPKNLYVISLGHNDAYQQTPVENFKASYRTILDSIKSHAPKAKIILCRQSNGYGDLNNGAELNNAISEIGIEYGLPVLNPENDPYLSSEYYVQTQIHRHPTLVGYSALAGAFNRLFCQATIDYFEYFKDYTGL